MFCMGKGMNKTHCGLRHGLGEVDSSNCWVRLPTQRLFGLFNVKRSKSAFRNLILRACS
jgi:hypothetical protein